MFSKFFIARPIMASVLSIVITLAGAVALLRLSVEQYPPITPPTVSVTATYPGANAQVVADTVAAPIEQQVNGVENMLYISSQCTNDGAYTLTVTFELGVDLNMAQVLVQNRVSLAMPQLPQEVQRQGINVKKRSPNITLAVNLISPDESKDQLALSNFAVISVKDDLARLEGVGDITVLGQRDYSMRIWLDPDKLASRGMTASDVANAIRQQNVQVAAGQVGQEPVPAGQEFQLTMSTLGRLTSPEQFEGIILKTIPPPARDPEQPPEAGQLAPGGQVVYLRDVARVEMGARNSDQTCNLDGKPSVGLAVFQLPGSNALSTAQAVYRKMEELKTTRFPKRRSADGSEVYQIDYRIVYDTTVFVKESIHEVFNTLRDAILLVAIVVLVFLQTWRATIIPLIAVPVSIVGTFAVMLALGFSLNNLSLFGLVLAIGIVVDDAIVVVENVERWLEQGYSPREAAEKAMAEVTGPIIATALVLVAVFVPCAVIAGITGQFFRQFAITIAVSTVISAINSLTLSPALCAILLKPPSEAHTTEAREPLPRPGIAMMFGLGVAYLLGPWLAARMVPGEGASSTRINSLYAAAFVLAFVTGLFPGLFLSRLINGGLSWGFVHFNKGFDIATGLYARGLGGLIRGASVVLVIYAGLLYLTYFAFTKAPTGFIPQQDKGYLLVNVQLPDSASVQRTRELLDQVEEIALKSPGVAHTLAIAGQSFLLSANGSNFGSMFVILDEFAHRHTRALSAEAIMASIRRECYQKVPGAMIAVFGAPPVDGLGTAGGFKLQVQDLGNLGLERLQGATDELVEKGNRQPGLVGLFTTFRANTPQLFVDIDRVKARTLGIELQDVFETLQIEMGGSYVNDFNQYNRTWQVNLQADARFRDRADQIRNLKVRNRDGKMVPLGTLVQVRDITGPVMVMRYNMKPSASINGNSRPDISSGQAVQLMEQLSDRVLPEGIGYEWTELTYQEIRAGNTAIYVFALGSLLVFLVLAAQYESWSLPLAVILIVPMCILCAVIGVQIGRMDINIFTQIGFVVLVGLSAKNAILIVEFARGQQLSGKPAREAAIEASRLRLRPILMTSFAFGLGVLPLVLASGAGAEMRFALGSAVFAGMIGVTFFGIFLTPVFYVVVDWLAPMRTGHPEMRSPDAEIVKPA